MALLDSRAHNQSLDLSTTILNFVFNFGIVAVTAHHAWQIRRDLLRYSKQKTLTMLFFQQSM